MKSSSSKEDENFSWDLKQSDSKNFTLTIKRKMVDDDNHCDRELRSQKRAKFETKISPLKDHKGKSTPGLCLTLQMDCIQSTF